MRSIMGGSRGFIIAQERGRLNTRTVPDGMAVTENIIQAESCLIAARIQAEMDLRAEGYSKKI